MSSPAYRGAPRCRYTPSRLNALPWSKHCRSIGGRCLCAISSAYCRPALPTSLGYWQRPQHSHKRSWPNGTRQKSDRLLWRSRFASFRTPSRSASSRARRSPMSESTSLPSSRRYSMRLPRNRRNSNTHRRSWPWCSHIATVMCPCARSGSRSRGVWHVPPWRLVSSVWFWVDARRSWWSKSCNASTPCRSRLSRC